MTLLALIPKTAEPAPPDDENPVSSMDRRVKVKLVGPKQIALVAVTLLALALLTYGFVRYGLQRTLSIDVERIVIATVQPGAFHDYIPITGNVEPRETVYLDA